MLALFFPLHRPGLTCHSLLTAITPCFGNYVPYFKVCIRKCFRERRALPRAQYQQIRGFPGVCLLALGYEGFGGNENVWFQQRLHLPLKLLRLPDLQLSMGIWISFCHVSAWPLSQRSFQSLDLTGFLGVAKQDNRLRSRTVSQLIACLGTARASVCALFHSAWVPPLAPWQSLPRVVYRFCDSPKPEC